MCIHCRLKCLGRVIFGWKPRNFDQFSWVGHFGFFFLHPHENWSNFLGYQGWVENLMITLVTSQKSLPPNISAGSDCSSEDNCLDFRMVGVCTAQIPLENIKVRKYQKNFFSSSNTQKTNENFY